MALVQNPGSGRRVGELNSSFVHPVLVNLYVTFKFIQHSITSYIIQSLHPPFNHYNLAPSPNEIIRLAPPGSEMVPPRVTGREGLDEP